MSRTQKTKFDAKKKTIRSSQSATERVQILRCEYWEKVKTVDPDNLVFLDEMGVLLGLTRTHARSKYGSIVSDLKPLYPGAKVIVVRARWCIRGSRLTKQQAPAGPKRQSLIASA